jgi:hypothetical protein
MPVSSNVVMKVYLDACCLNHLTDDQTAPRIRQEAEVVEQIIRRMRVGEIQWISSEALRHCLMRSIESARRKETGECRPAGPRVREPRSGGREGLRGALLAAQ